MRIGLLITSIGNFGQKGFYNAQEIGLAKELDKLFDEVIIYKAVPLGTSGSKTKIKGCEHSTLNQIPVKGNGINGVWDCSLMDNTLDALVYFSDTQLAVPKVFKWCEKNRILMYPYIGVIESHSTSKLKRVVIDMLFQRNIDVYKKCTCFVKTPMVQEKLRSKGLKNCVVTPVGLDVTLLHNDYQKIPVSQMKEKWGYTDEKILLFIGRMTEEKQPLRMIDVFRKVYERDRSYRLLMIGKGELLQEMKKVAEGFPVQFIDQIPNKDIWELYRIADAFVNLNQQEIFGMAILEAMHYGCKVVAWKAPGPSFIIEDGVSGCLAESDEEIIVDVMDKKIDPEAAHNRVLNSFTWETAAKRIAQQLQKNRAK